MKRQQNESDLNKKNNLMDPEDLISLETMVVNFRNAIQNPDIKNKTYLSLNNKEAKGVL